MGEHSLAQWDLTSWPNLLHRKYCCSFYILLATSVKQKQWQEICGKSDSVLLINVIPPLLDKRILFQVTKRHSIFFITPSQIDLALKEAPAGKTGYFKDKRGYFVPNASQTIYISNITTGASSNFSKFTFHLETTLEQINSSFQDQRQSGFSPQKYKGIIYKE